MAITHVASTSASGTTSAAPSYPAGMVAGDTLYLGAGCCDPARTFPEIAGWTKLFDESLGGGTVGAGTGARRVALYRKQKVDGTESGTVTVTPVGGSDVCFAAMTAWRCGVGSMITALYQTGQDTAAGSAISCVASSVMGEITNDVMLGWAVIPSNVNITGQGFSATDAVYGTLTEHVDAGSSSGDDIAGSWISQSVTSGIGTAATTYASTVTTTAGTIFIRLREVATSNLSIVTVSEHSWTTTTTPKDLVLASAQAGDWIFSFTGGDDFEPGSDTTAASVTTFAGTTLPWREVGKQLVGASADWILSAVTQVSVTGSVTVRAARTQGGTPGAWGGFVMLIRNCAGMGNHAEDLVVGAEKVLNLAVQDDSAVGFLSCDWSTTPVGTGFTPAGATEVERAVEAGTYVAHAAYWPDEVAGTRDYGISGGSGTNFRNVAMEMLTAATVPPPPEEGPRNANAMQRMSRGWY